MNFHNIDEKKITIFFVAFKVYPSTFCWVNLFEYLKISEDGPFSKLYSCCNHMSTIGNGLDAWNIWSSCKLAFEFWGTRRFIFLLLKCFVKSHRPHPSIILRYFFHWSYERSLKLMIIPKLLSIPGGPCERGH